MKRVLAVFKKEVLDNLRDRQTVFYALLFGPVLIPLLITGALVGSVKKLSIDYDQVSTLDVINADIAPNLIQFLHGHNIDVTSATEDFAEQLREGAIPVVLEIMPDFADQFRSGSPASLTLHVNEADKDSAKAARRITNLLSAYERTIASLRMQVRGLDPVVFDTLAVNTNDVSDDGAEGQLLSSMLPFLFIISMVMGGFYLAIDTTAGERERASLEPLLALPLERWQLVLGKYLATLLFVALSVLLTAISIYLIFRFFPSPSLTAAMRFDAGGIARAWLLASPLIFLITSLLIAISAFTRSTKEAQTYLGLMMIIPMAPFFILQFVTIRSATAVMALPMLSQYKLLEKVTRNDAIPLSHIVLSVTTTLLVAALLLQLAFWLYRQDRILR
ncbi:MAG: ABC transporter permease [Gammaproteobacteria bacterium]|nr:ABC transporter permease [Gammaproteobacteria bacterium]